MAVADFYVGVCSSAEKFVNDQDLDKAKRKVLQTLDGVENVSAEQRDGIVNAQIECYMRELKHRGISCTCSLLVYLATMRSMLSILIRDKNLPILSNHSRTRCHNIECK